MTGIGTQIAALLAAGVVTLGGLLGAGSADGGGPGAPGALVIDAAIARDGRELVDARLKSVDAELRLPRTAAEARANVRYLAASGHRLVVAGAEARAAARAAGVSAAAAPDLTGALAALR